MDNQFVLRRANYSDVDALSQLYQKAFRETFMEDFAIPHPENDLDSHFRSAESPEYFRESLNDPQRATWLIEGKTNGELVAFASVGLCDSDDIPHPDVCPNKDGAINRLYVLRDRRSLGFGQQLMLVVLPWLEEYFPARPIWLTVWSGNFRAQKFYRHYGFTKVGDFKYAVGEWKDDEFIMKRPPITT
jgi:ribosomal protein S18 acetylase RimI-like enzyme